MSKTSCAARCLRGSVQGVLRAPAEGEGGVAHREDLAATASATLERSTGTVAHGKRAARERRRRSKVSRRRRAGHAPPARRGRRVRVPCAFKRPAKTLWWWWWWCAHQLRITSGRLPLIGGSILRHLLNSDHHTVVTVDVFVCSSPYESESGEREATHPTREQGYFISIQCCLYRGRAPHTY